MEEHVIVDSSFSAIINAPLEQIAGYLSAPPDDSIEPLLPEPRSRVCAQRRQPCRRAAAATPLPREPLLFTRRNQRLIKQLRRQTPLPPSATPTWGVAQTTFGRTG